MDANQIIDTLGGTTAVARLCEVTKASVSQWRTEGIPKARLMFLKVVRPDVFEPQNPQPVAQVAEQVSP